MSFAEIVGVDILWYDEIVILPEMPPENGSAFVEDCSTQGGGKVCSALVSAARQGVSTKLLSVCGDDARSRFLMKDFLLHKVDTSAIRQIPNYEVGWSVVVSDRSSGGRRILWHKNEQQPGLTSADVQAFAQDIRQAKYIHLCRMDEIDRAAAAIARESGTLVSLDADYYSEEIRASLPLVDILIGSQEFYEQMFPQGGNWEENMRSLLSIGPSTVIFTFGSRGCRGIADKTAFTCPAFPVEVVDTVGAGDDFHGGYLAALCLGYANGYEAARFASALSAIKCTAIGGRAGIPTRSMIEEFLHSGTFDRSEIQQRVDYYRKQH